MDLCSELRLEEDHTSAMNIVTIPSIDSVVFIVKSNSNNAM